MKKRIIIFIISITCLLLAYGITISYAGESYYPLDKGKTWIHIMSGKDASGFGGSFKLKTVNLGPRNLKGKKVVPQKISSGNRAEFSFIVSDEKGICEYANQEPSDIKPKIHSAPDFYIKLPVQISIVGVSEDVFVSAGSFSKCIHVKKFGTINKDIPPFDKAQVMVEEHSWFAPGVGRVRVVTKEKSNNLMLGSGRGSMELESYTK